MSQYNEKNILSSRKVSVQPNNSEEGPASRKSIHHVNTKSIQGSRQFSGFFYVGKLEDKERQIETVKSRIEWLQARKKILYADWEVIMTRLQKMHTLNCSLYKKFDRKFFQYRTTEWQDARQIKNSMLMAKHVKMMSLTERFSKGFTLTEIGRNHIKLLGKIYYHNRRRSEELRILLASRIAQNKIELSKNSQFIKDYSDTNYSIRKYKELKLKMKLAQKQIMYDSGLRFIVKRIEDRFKRYDIYSNAEEILSVYRFVMSSIVKSVVCYMTKLMEARYQFLLKAEEKEKLKAKLTTKTKRYAYLKERIRSLEQYYNYFRFIKRTKLAVRKVTKTLMKRQNLFEVNKALFGLKNTEKQENLNKVKNVLLKTYLRNKIDMFKQVETVSKRTYEGYSFFAHYVSTVKNLWNLDLMNDKFRPTLSADPIIATYPWNVPLMENLKDYNQNLSVVLKYLRAILYYKSIFENYNEFSLNFSEKTFTSVKNAIHKEEKSLYERIKYDISQTSTNKSRCVRQMVIQTYDHSPGR